MTVKELRAKAKELGLKGFWTLKKAELEKLIEENTVHLHDSEVLFTGECSGEGEWLNHRRIGATDTSVLYLDSAYRKNIIDRPDKYKNPFLMFEERKGRYKKEISFDSEVAMDFGHYAEDFIIAHLPALFYKEFKINLQETLKGNQVVANKNYPLWSCTPDSWVKIEGEWYPVELKTGNSYTSYEWEREEVPNKYFAQVQQQLAVLGKNKGFLVGFADNRFTRVYEIERDDKLITQAYEITKRFQYYLDNDIVPELNGCEAECEYLKAEFQGFGNKYEKVPSIDIDAKTVQNYFAMEDTKKELSKETKEIEKDMKMLTCIIQNKMLEFETENLVINGSYLATWKIDARGAKRFSFKELKDNQKIKEVA